jgi:hypothetical protein
MTAFIHFWAESVIKFRWLVFAVAAAIVAVALYGGRNIPFDNTNERLFIKGDPSLVAFDKLVELFGDNEYFVVGIQARPNDADVFEPQTLRVIDGITEFLEAHPAVTQTRSLTRFQHTHADDDSLSTDDLIFDIDEFASDPSLRTEAKNILADEPLAIGTLVTKDMRNTRIAARVEYRRDSADHKIELVKDAYAFVEAQGYLDQGYDIRFSGQPLINARFEMHTREDSMILNPAMAALMLVVLFFSFRAWNAMLSPWLVIGLGIITVLGLQGFLNYPHTPVDSALIPTLIIIGIGVSVHVLVEFYHLRGEGLTGKEAARDLIVVLWRPAFFTALTTAIGFYALSVTKITAVREFALLGAIGPLVLFVYAMTVLPAALSFINKVSAKTTQVVHQGLVSRLTLAVPDFVRRFQKPIVMVGIGFVLFAVYAVPAIKVDTNFILYFKAENPARQDMLYFDEVYKGVMPLEIILDSGEKEGVKNPEFLRRVDTLQDFLRAMPTLGSFNSLVDYLKQINQALHGDDPAYFTVPDSSNAVAQYLFLYQNSGPEEDLTDIKDFDNRFVRITVPIMNMPASEMSVELAKIQQELDQHYADMNAITTGSMRNFHEQNIYTAQGMYQSFSIALLVISACFVFIFRSFKYGLLSMVPSILPILIVGGGVGLLGIHLDLGTMIVGAMTMGIAVDDAIHVVNRYLLAKQQGANTDQAIRRAMHESGRAVVFSSVVLVLGFGVLIFANFMPIMYVGLFGASIMFLALIGDLIFLPAILYWVDGKDQSDGLEARLQSAKHPTSVLAQESN